MSGSNLFVYLGMILSEIPGISDEDKERIKQGFSAHCSGERLYVPAYKKSDHLAKLDALDGAPPRQVSKMLGISVRQVQRLRRLR